MLTTLRYFTAVMVMTAFCAAAAASETSDKFAACLPNLAAEDLKARQTAQQDWQTYCRQKGNDPAVAKEIVSLTASQLLEKDTPAEAAVWLLRQLGIVGDASAVPALAKYLASEDVRLRDEAARSLANIPGKEALDALKESQSEQAKTALISETVKTNMPKIGVETTMPLALPYAPDAEVAKWMGDYAKLDAIGKTATLTNLTARAGQGEAAQASCTPYAALALEAARSDDAALRSAGFMAIGAFGDTKGVAFLIETSFGSDEAKRNLAKLALSRTTGKSVDEELAKLLMVEKDENKFNALAEILRNRYSVAAGPVLLTQAKKPATADKLKLLQLAEGLSSVKDAGDFVEVFLLLSAQADAAKDADARREARKNKEEAEKIIARFLKGDASVAIATLTAKKLNWTAPDYLPLIGRIGDDKTLEQIRKSKSSLLAFAQWPNARVAEDLLAAVNSSATEADKSRALRGYVRVMSLSGGAKKDDPIGIEITDAEKVKKLSDVFKLAKQGEDRKFVIKRVGQIRTIESLRFVLPYIDNADLQDTVIESVLDLAHHVEFKRKHMDEFTAALDRVAATTKVKEYLDRVERYKSQK